MKVLRTALLILSCLMFVAPAQAETHWLDFNPYAFSTEFFRENGVLRGSCGATSVVIVESDLNLLARIPTDAVKNKNAQMRQDPNLLMRPSLSGMYYISSIDGIGTRLQRDGYKVNWLGSVTCQTAARNIFDALGRKHWVIIVARHGFNNSELGHFYPIYGGDLKFAPNGSVDEARSSLNAIDDFYGFRESYNPNNSIWGDMYKRGVNLKAVLDSMKSASLVGVYNAIEVYK
jgi:hypothetical protein